MILLLCKVFVSLKLLCYIAVDMDGVTHDLQLDLAMAGAGAEVIAQVAVTGFSFYSLESSPSLFFSGL